MPGYNRSFIDLPRFDPQLDDPEIRKASYAEISQPLPAAVQQSQGKRCMECGIPYCEGPTDQHLPVARGKPDPNFGCPINNQILAMNYAVSQGQQETAFNILLSTLHRYGALTSRVCPAPCESSCSVNKAYEAPVTIRLNEGGVSELAHTNGWLKPVSPGWNSGLRIAVIGSGPAGMACAEDAAMYGHDVVLFERNQNPGGLLRYGIPDFKLGAEIVQREFDRIHAGGVDIRCGAEIGSPDYPAESLISSFDAIVLAGGCEVPIDLAVPGRELKGVHFAMELLAEQNRVNSGEISAADRNIDLKGKHVVVIGGGDTGSDCIGTAARNGAATIRQITNGSKPPEKADLSHWPNLVRVQHISPSHEEAGILPEYNIDTRQFLGEKGQLRALQCVEGTKSNDGVFLPKSGSEFQIKADIVLLAMGYSGVVRPGLIDQLGVKLNGRGNVAANHVSFRTEHPHNGKPILAAGDMRRGQSLVVWALREGHDVARALNKILDKQYPGLIKAIDNYLPGARSAFRGPQPRP
jgi:glutamate synthase (NADPH) small chain